MKQVLSILLLCLVALAPAAFADAPTPELLTPGERAWLSQHPDIMLGVGQDWVPSVVMGGNGEATGFAFDHIDLLNRKLGTSLRLQAGPWPKMVEKALALELAGLDLVANIPERKAQFLLTDAFHTVHAFIYLRTGEHVDRPDLAMFKGKKVGYLKGILRFSKLLAIYPGIEAVPLETNDALAQGLLNGSLDAALGAYDLEYWRASHGLLGYTPTRIVLDMPSDMSIGVRKDWPQLVGILNKGLAAISPDEMAGLYRRWFGSEYLQRVEDVKVPLTASEQAWLADHPHLTLGTVGDHPPVVIVSEGGGLSGILVDYVKLLNRRLGTDIQIALDSWPKTLKKATGHKVDLVGLVFPVEAHRPYFDFSRRVLSAYHSIYVRSDDPNPPQTLADLRGKRVGYINSSRIVEQMTGREATLKLVPFENNATLAQALLNGHVDAAINNAAFDYWRKQHGETGFKISTLLPEIGGDMVFGVRKDWPQLTAILDKGLASLSEEERLAILNRWLGGQLAATPEPPKLNLTEEERDFLAAHRVLKAAIIPDMAPIEFVDEKGGIQGISVAYLKRLQALLGIRFEWVKMASGQQSLQSLEAGAVDLMPSLTATADRQKRLHFTEPYLVFPAGVFTASKIAYIGGLEELAGKHVAVIEHGAAQEWLQTDWPRLELVKAANTREALRQLTKGQAFAFVGNMASTSYAIGQLGLAEVKVVGETPYDYKLSMAVRQDWPLLAGILQKGLDAIPKPERDAIFHEWISIQYQHGVDYTLLWQVLAAAGVLFLLVFYWNRKLAREVGLRRAAEAASRLAQAEAERANRAKSDFLAGVSHDLRTPLNAVLGFSQILESDSQTLSADQKKLVQSIQRGGHSLLGLIDQLLDMARIEADRFVPEPVDWDTGALLQEMEVLFRGSAETKGLALVIEATPSLPGCLHGDVKRLRQALMNLMDNAIKYTNLGSVSLRMDYTDQHLRVDVVDTGVGIAAQDCERIFELFHRVNPAQQGAKGTGIGLSITKSLIEGLGGTITMSSEPGKGSHFQIRVPAQLAMPLAATGTDAHSPAGSGVSKRILIVDDEPNNLAILRKLLELEGFTVREADGGQRCIEIATEWLPDLILMDLRMPDMDGLQTTRALREMPKLRKIPIVAASAAAFAEDRAKSLAAGFDAHLVKPLFREDLLKTLGALLPSKGLADDADTGAVSPTRGESLTREQTERMAQFLDTGSITALQEFAEILAQENRCPALARQIKSLAEDFDLEGLRRLLGELRKNSPAE